MSLRAVLLAPALGALVLATGCQDARYITDERDQIVSLDQIDIQDFRMAAQEVIDSMLAAGVLERAPQQPATIKVTQVVNETDQRFDRALLTQNVLIALNQTGRVVAISDDPETMQLARERAAREGRELPYPFYTLSGRVIQVRAKAGQTRQNAYVFQVILATTDQGLNVWMGESQIVKQGTRNSVGF